MPASDPKHDLSVANQRLISPPHPVLTEFYSDRSSRADFVNELFDRAARHYDWISRALSLGTDQYYRRWALRNAGLMSGMRLLDVATGTGLVAKAASELELPPQHIIGVDPSRGMLLENRRQQKYQLVQAIGEKLPFADRQFDFVSMGYALRHVDDLLLLFHEFHRVLKSNGRLLILEITRPQSRPGFWLLGLYMKKLVPWLTRFHTSQKEATRLLEYYWATIVECLSPDQILQTLRQAGFSQVNRKTTGGVLTEFLASK